ncbi:MAG TPA: DUF4865 family protein [Alphaproteobacteria bacterium]|jgi:hypothetical protein|nr:DUF4865 family protein [Alphaproteobacteria bacterium]
MYAMQYEIALPADYDMAVIRQRIAAKGPLLDDFPGLALKAYLVRERGADGSPVNEYAPFYLWASTDAMGRFLWGGGGFQAICGSFGRPRVRHWTGVACARGPARAVTPCTATRETSPLPPAVDPAAAVDRARRALSQRARRPDVYATAVAIDPSDWELVHFTVWAGAAPKAAGTRYRVLHLSSPELDLIAEPAFDRARRSGCTGAAA